MPEARTNFTDHFQSENLLSQIRRDFAGKILAQQTTCDGIPTVWVARDNIKSLLNALHEDTNPHFEMLFDLTAIDERLRSNRQGQPASEFTVVFELI
jgi:NADH-quinone oxidoreductase subunit C/D